MNSVCLVGRIVKDPDLRISTTGTNITRFTVAVNRTVKKEGQQEADFINCTSFGKQAEFVATYLKKGYLVSIEGKIQTGSYENKEGQKVYTFDVICDSIQNLTPKDSNSSQETPKKSYQDIEVLPEDLPFS